MAQEETKKPRTSSRKWGLFAVAVAIVVMLCAAATAAALIGARSSSGPSPKMPSEVKTYAKDWPLPSKDYSNSRATTDSTINSQNVGDLGIAWSYNITGLGSFGGATCTPLILGNTVIFQDAKANVIALDLQTGAVKWAKYYNASKVEGPNGAGAGYGKIFVAKDAYTMAALDLTTGEEIWTNKLSNVPTTGIDIQPLVYDGLVYTSTVPGTGDIFYSPGGIGVLYALDQATGKVKWNFSTVKGDLWGHPEVNSGGGSWYNPAVDTKTGIMYWDVANPAPFAGAKNWPSGSSFDTALYTDSVLALNHKNGKLKWYAQALPHDIWDHDLQISPILANANIHGEDQNILLAAGKMGYVYAFNRDTGNQLWAVPVGEHMNDLLDPISEPTTVLPGVLGGVETPMAYHDGIVYVPVIDMSTEYTPTGLNPASIDFAGGKGQLVAINVSYGHIMWAKKLNSINVGGATVVNDVVFTATFDGFIYGFHAKTGEELFRFKAPAGINAWPAVAGDTIVWPAGSGAHPSVIALRLNAGPRISIISPKSGTSVQGPNVTVAVDVSRFTLVNELSQPNVAGQGHIHYFLDVEPPIEPGVPAIPSTGAYFATADTSYTWVNLTDGGHMISAELVNNDHTPLVPAVVDTVYVIVGGVEPTLRITSPADGSTLYDGNVTVTVDVANFNLVDKLGQANVQGEGHIHYFLDVLPPTTPGAPAITASGTYAATVSTSYTWQNLSVGTHMLSAELVNNDHTPLVPPVTAFVNATVGSVTGAMTIYLMAQNIAFNVSTISVPAGTNVTIVFENMDAGVSHNFALYTDSSGTTLIFRGAIMVGIASVTYNFIAPSTPGNYFFRCDVHPSLMTGTFVVT